MDNTPTYDEFDDTEDNIEWQKSDVVFEPVSQGEVNLRGKPILTARLEDNQGYVSLNSCSGAFGISRQALFARLNRRSDWFSEDICRIRLMTPGGPQVHVCMNAVALPLFLAGTSLNSIKNPKDREYMRAFIKEAELVLAEHFGITERNEIEFMRDTMARLVAEREAEDQGLEGKDVQAYVNQQLDQLRKEHEEKIRQIREAFANLRTQIRAAAPSAERLTPEEIGQVSNTVRALGYMLQERGVNNPYPRIYANIWRMSGVGTTERIRRSQFEFIMTWMEKQIEILSNAPRLTPEEENNLLNSMGL